MKKVLHIIESLEFGGAEMVVINLANKLSDKYDVSICMTKREGDLCSRVNARVKLHFLGCKEGNDLTAITKILSIIKHDNIDIVHIHNWSVYLEGVLAARLAGVVKILHTIHGSYAPPVKGFKNLIKYKTRHFLENILSIFVYRFIPVSLSIKDYLQRDFWINANKILPVHNGIAGLDRSKKIINDSAVLKLVTVGRIATIKNHTLMLNGLRKAIDAGAHVILGIVGNGPEYASVRELATTLNLDKYVEFMGFRSDIADILADKDVYILTSDYEGISISLLEAMSMGLPAIATHVGGVPETVIHNQTGLLIENGNIDALATAIIFMASNKNTVVSMGNEAYDFFIKEFEDNNFIRKYDEIYAH